MLLTRTRSGSIEYGIPYSELGLAGMIPLDPLPNLIDQVYARILEGITDRSLPPGHRIRQNELAEKLGVSRQPVSHALHLLHRQGLVAESGRRGFEVTRLDPERIRQLYEVRGAIDALAARLAAGRARSDASGRAQLEAALQAGRTISKDTLLSRLIALDVDFHGAIHRLAGNPAIAVDAPLRRSVDKLTYSRIFIALGLESTSNARDTLPAMPLWPTW